MELTEEFGRYLGYISESLGRSERKVGLRDYCRGLMFPLQRKSIEPLAAAIDLIAISYRGGAGGRDRRGRLVFTIQCPALEMTPEVPSVAAKHGSSAIAVANDSD